MVYAAKNQKLFHFTTDIWAENIKSESKNISYFSTDIFSAFVHRYAKISIKNAPSAFLRTRAQYICGYEILENSKHSRCPYTRRFSIKETLPLILKMLVGMSPKPSIFTKGRLPMANRTRPNQILFFVSDDEKRMIQAKMAQLGTKNMGAYLRKMAIDGYIIKVDYGM